VTHKETTTNRSWNTWSIEEG